MKVFIIDDHQLIIEGMRSSLSKDSSLEIVGEAQTGAEALGFLRENQVDVILLDINLPDISGIDLCKQIIEIRPDARILGVSTFAQRMYVARLMENGARGYILKNSPIDEIKEAIYQIARGNVFLSKDAADLLYRHDAGQGEFPPLTRREIEILRLVTDGLTAPEIADKLHLSQLTVESHRRNLMTKLKAKNVASLVKLAMTKNLI